MLAACSSKSAAPSGGSSTPPVLPTVEAEYNLIPVDSAVPFEVPASTTQLVLALTDGWDGTETMLQLFAREGPDLWRSTGKPWPGVVGRTGTGWGSGLHGRGAPPGRDGPIKHEGDGKSPAGVFALTGAFGYASEAPKGTRIGYQQVDTNWKCVDDPASHEYNRVLDARTTHVDWKSAEEMRRDDDQYSWVVEIAHNASRTPKDGSCIFLHVWAGPKSTTVGCTAMDAPFLASLLRKLDPAANPVLVLLPRREYEALATSWKLPR